MKLPFTADQFLEIFKSYNESIFPIQIIFYLIAAIALFLLFSSTDKSRIISLILSFFWLWIGIVYNIIFFSKINKAAYLFGSLFIMQGIIFFIYGIVSNKLILRYNKNILNKTGIIFISYALIVYPVLGYFLGRPYPYSITIGLPCPTTIFTFGILLFSEKKIPFAALIIPLLWSIMGFTAALNFSVYEDFGLILSGLISFTLLTIQNRNAAWKQKQFERS
ncbi:MAG TPA: DUF6064 family protein [Ignavibacteriaceae bacterium]|nr:DUF6064 family protein [Ignavibacteriaceae bacterium]